MEKPLTLILIGLIIYSCNDNKTDQRSSEDKGTTNKSKRESREFPNDDVTKNKAFIELVNYKYKDSENYGKSSDTRTLTLKGRTNLPENTSVKINIKGFVPSTKEEDVTDTYGNAKVRNGKFEINLKPWNIPQSIIFSVFKNDRSKQVLNILGESGDKMKILEENKAKFPSICFFTEEVSINEELIASLKSGKSSTYTIQTAQGLNTPEEKALAKFINAWKKKKSEEFVKNGYSIKYKLYIKPMISHKGIQGKTITANVIKEDGKWGVNATSAIGGLYN